MYDLKWTGAQGQFALDNAKNEWRSYFPLCNGSPFLSSINPDLQGDIKADQNSFVTPPVSVVDLYNLRSGRQVWVRLPSGKVWAACGSPATDQKDRVKVDAGLLYHQVSRTNGPEGLASTSLNFVPLGKDRVEVMKFVLENKGKKTLTVDLYPYIPLYARSADTLRDHRHVTSLLNRISMTKESVLVQPVMLFNERGHASNQRIYFFSARGPAGKVPSGFFPTVSSFIGSQGHPDRPRAVYQGEQGSRTAEQGREAAGSCCFSGVQLKPSQKIEFTFLCGLADTEKEFRRVRSFYLDPEKRDRSFVRTCQWWNAEAERVSFSCGDQDWNGWIRWVGIQPLLRRIFGNSFLPDFDYGKGGKGWRDLWQDILAFLLSDPGSARRLLLNNFSGVRIDGSNATIIGSKPGEFVADRNDISRIWMDHGVWPWFTTLFYIHQTGDLNILHSRVTYFKDALASRASEHDQLWDPSQGKVLKDTNGKVWKGTVLEHVLIQSLTQFYNSGENGMIRLEDADWNDGMDMAFQKGESVAFTAFYAGNLLSMAEVLKRLTPKIRSVKLLKEINILLGNEKSFSSPQARQKILKRYFHAVHHTVSGEEKEVMLNRLIDDLQEKAEWLKKRIQSREMIRLKNGSEFYNGYYGNNGKPVEGEKENRVLMTLPGQVFPLLFRIGNRENAEKVVRSVNRYLCDKKLGSIRLNTDFGRSRPDLGRAFSFAYGTKENGAVFSHMTVMYAYALYKNGMVKEGYSVLNSLYRLWKDHDHSRMYPGLPEYFDNTGQGYYLYLTGSASWYVFTLLTQVFGVRGYYGDLLLAPKLVKGQFVSEEVSCRTVFGMNPLLVTYRNKKKLDHGAYSVVRVLLNGTEVPLRFLDRGKVLISRKDLDASSQKHVNKIEVELL